MYRVKQLLDGSLTLCDYCRQHAETVAKASMPKSVRIDSESDVLEGYWP